MGTATVASGGDGTKTGFPLPSILVPIAAQCVRLAHSREAFTADGTGFLKQAQRVFSGLASSRRLCDERSFLSVESVQSAVQFLWLRLHRPVHLRVFATIQSKLLSMSNLHTKSRFSDQGKSR